MITSPTFRLPSDALGTLFDVRAGPHSALLLWQQLGKAAVTDGHSTEWRPYARVLLEEAVAIIARADSICSPWIHGLDSAYSGCPPVALVVSPRGAAILLPRIEAYALARQANPRPILRQDHV